MSITLTPAIFAARRMPLPRDALVALAGTAAMLAWHAAGGFPTLADSGGDNDSVLRLVQVRDLIAGQGWFDPVQYRMGPEGGFAMHWSRLVDLPIALLVAAFGETAALIVWPSLLFALGLFAIVRAAREAAGDAAVLPAAVLGGMALHASGNFVPAALDHHNVQLVLTLAALLCLLRAPASPRAGLLAGGFAAAMLAVGMETAPYAAAACAVVSLAFLIRGEEEARLARGFGAAFAGVGAAALAAALPARDWLSVQCDAFSFPQASLAMLGGGGLALIACVPALRQSRARRAAALCALAVPAAWLALAAFPQCLGDPYAGVDPQLKRYWLDAVSEARSAASVFLSRPILFLGSYATPLLALLVLAWTVARKGMDRSRAVLAAFLLAALAVSAWQVRGAVFALAIAVIVLAGWVAGLRSRALREGGTRAQLAMAAGWIASFSLSWQLAGALLLPAGAAEGQEKAGGRCYAHADYEALAALPPGLVLAVSNQGSPILRNTPHSVLNGPYHRNNEGNRAALDMLMGGEDEARAAALGRGVDYVVLCRGNPETAFLVRSAPQGLLADLDAGRAPAWLTPLAAGQDEALKIYRIVR